MRSNPKNRRAHGWDREISAIRQTTSPSARPTATRVCWDRQSDRFNRMTFILPPWGDIICGSACWCFQLVSWLTGSETARIDAGRLRLRWSMLRSLRRSKASRCGSVLHQWLVSRKVAPPLATVRLFALLDLFAFWRSREGIQTIAPTSPLPWRPGKRGSDRSANGPLSITDDRSRAEAMQSTSFSPQSKGQRRAQHRRRRGRGRQTDARPAGTRMKCGRAILIGSNGGVGNRGRVPTKPPRSTAVTGSHTLHEIHLGWF